MSRDTTKESLENVESSQVESKKPFLSNRNKKIIEDYVGVYCFNVENMANDPDYFLIDNVNQFYTMLRNKTAQEYLQEKKLEISQNFKDRLGDFQIKILNEMIRRLPDADDKYVFSLSKHIMPIVNQMVQNTQINLNQNNDEKNPRIKLSFEETKKALLEVKNKLDRAGLLEKDLDTRLEHSNKLKKIIDVKKSE